ncbi:putative hydroperoxide dehydratase [Helianthus annuus]|nr:putative hydroperoxide dehydratase [Helianthus annuus]
MWVRPCPPVPPQYGKAKSNFTIESHDATFEIKEGEMLFGYQPFATTDPKVFDRPEEFVPDRFVGDGEALLKYVMWSNGPETESPTLENKQCAGKNFVVLITRLFVIELFRRYSSFEVEFRADFRPVREVPPHRAQTIEGPKIDVSLFYI